MDMEQAMFHPVVDFGKVSDGFFGTAGRQVLEKVSSFSALIHTTCFPTPSLPAFGGG